MKHTRYFIMLSLFIAGCGKGRQGADVECATDDCLQARAYAQVIAVHDAVMPRLADIRQLKKEITGRMTTTTDSTLLGEWRQLHRQLTVADEAMWVWMRQFKSDLSGMPPAEALVYLQAEQRKIDSVATMITTAIAAAEAQLAED